MKKKRYAFARQLYTIERTAQSNQELYLSKSRGVVGKIKFWYFY